MWGRRIEIAERCKCSHCYQETQTFMMPMSWGWVSLCREHLKKYPDYVKANLIENIVYECTDDEERGCNFLYDGLLYKIANIKSIVNNDEWAEIVDKLLNEIKK